MKNNILRVLLLLLMLVLIFAFLGSGGVFVTDKSAERTGYGMLWQGIRYVRTAGEYHEKRTIAKTTDGWKINEVKEDPSHTFVVMRDFLDQALLVREDYEIPLSGDITSVFWESKTIQNVEFCSAIAAILDAAQPDFFYETEALPVLNEHQKARIVYVAYEGCPVPTVYQGYLGMIEGEWRITIPMTKDSEGKDTPAGMQQVACYTIPAEFVPVLEHTAKELNW